ncbi:MAG: GTP 3',8-cyclase MoaA [Methanotrichaceae archaeon]|nr:GTP 3',8-cyclase MoaA [Methanotrichaceae archaeon]
MGETALMDRFGRRATGLRIALTSRCNLRCLYCHHEGEASSFKEIKADTVLAVAMAASELGMRNIKFTGGEPLLRTDLEDILLHMPQDLNLSMTTNGIFLEQRALTLAEAGLERVNISLDSLNSETYQAITSSRDGDLQRVLAGIDAALDAGLEPIKLNVVVLGANELEIPTLIELARSKGLILQLIELLDLNGLGISGDIEGIEQYLQSRSDRIVRREMHRRRKYFLEGAEVEVVRPMDNTEFCSHCTRIRITSDGKIKPCLLRNDNLIEIKTTNKNEIKRLLRDANKHREPFFKLKE